MTRPLVVHAGIRTYSQLVEAGYLEQIASLFRPGRTLGAVERILRERYPDLNPSSLRAAVRHGREIAAAARAAGSGAPVIPPPTAGEFEPGEIRTYRYNIVVGARGTQNVVVGIESPRPLSTRSLHRAARELAQRQLDTRCENSPTRCGEGARLIRRYWVISAYSY